MRRDKTADPLGKLDVLRLRRSLRRGDDPTLEVPDAGPRLEAAIAEAEAAPDGLARNRYGDPIGTADTLAAILARLEAADDEGAGS